MNVQILLKNGYYSLYINGRFYGNYDTFPEAVRDLESLKGEKEVES